MRNQSESSMCSVATHKVNIIHPKGVQTVFEELPDSATMVGPTNGHIGKRYSLGEGYTYGSFVVTNSSSLRMPDSRIAAPNCFSVPVHNARLLTKIQGTRGTHDRTRLCLHA